MNEAAPRDSELPALKSASAPRGKRAQGPAKSGAADQNSIEFVTTKLQAVAKDAVATLHAGLFNPSPSVRIRAALAILNLGKDFEKISDLESRLSALERRKWG